MSVIRVEKSVYGTDGERVFVEIPGSHPGSVGGGAYVHASWEDAERLHTMLGAFLTEFREARAEELRRAVESAREGLNLKTEHAARVIAERDAAEAALKAAEEAYAALLTAFPVPVPDPAPEQHRVIQDSPGDRYNKWVEYPAGSERYHFVTDSEYAARAGRLESGTLSEDGKYVGRTFAQIQYDYAAAKHITPIPEFKALNAEHVA